MLDVKIKKLCSSATIPQYANYGDAGLDLTAVSVAENNDYTQYGTGLAVQVPYGYVGLLFPRSSNSKKDLLLCNSVGCVDHGYTGEVCLRFKKIVKDSEFPNTFKTYEVGDRVAQLIIMPVPRVNFIQVDELDSTERGAGGFGSSGN